MSPELSRQKKRGFSLRHICCEPYWLLADRLSFAARVSQGVFTSETRAFLFLGVLGGFTTFSTFGNETMNLFRDGENTWAFFNITIHTILGLGAVWLGRTLAYLIWR